MYKKHPKYNLMVGRDGSIIGTRGNILKQRVDKYGYYNVSIYCNGKRSTKTSHRIICETYHENPNNYTTVNHKDGNKLNNNIENLEWASVSMNINHAYQTGLHETILSLEDVVYIYENPDNLTPTQLSKKLEVNRNTVYGVVYDNKWTDITKDLKKNHIKSSNQKHNQKCLGISKSGEKYEFSNKTKFAKENDLDVSAITKCISNKRKSHKGWKFLAI